MENYFESAFQKLRLIEETFDIDDHDKLDELTSFVADDVELPKEEIIYDEKAEGESDIADAYVGKVILECDCCHSWVYKDSAEVVIDEESGLANIDDECPVCKGKFGFNVVGKIQDFDNPEEPTEEEELPADDVPVEEDEDEISDEDIEEALHEALNRRLVVESYSDDTVFECAGGEHVTLADIKAYWEDNKEEDSYLASFSDFNSWLDACIDEDVFTPVTTESFHESLEDKNPFDHDTKFKYAGDDTIYTLDDIWSNWYDLWSNWHLDSDFTVSAEEAHDEFIEWLYDQLDSGDIIRIVGESLHEATEGDVVYKDTGYGSGKDTITKSELEAYWNEHLHDDPVLAEYGSSEEWIDDTVASGLLTVETNESLHEAVNKGTDDFKFVVKCMTDYGYTAQEVIEDLRVFSDVDRKIDALADQLIADGTINETEDKLATVTKYLDENYSIEEMLDALCDDDSVISQLASEYADYVNDDDVVKENLSENITIDVENKKITSDDTKTNVKVDLKDDKVKLCNDDCEHKEKVVPLSDEEMSEFKTTEDEEEEENAGDELGELGDEFTDELPAEAPIEGEASIEEPAPIEEPAEGEEPEEPAEGEEEEEEDEDKGELITDSLHESFNVASFDHSNQAYLRRVYSNVKSYSTTNVSADGNKLVVEGLITFKSGATRNSKYIFESTISKNKKYLRLTGVNEMFSNKNTFKVKCVLDEGMYCTKTFSYDYVAKKLDESFRVCGRIL